MNKIVTPFTGMAGVLQSMFVGIAVALLISSCAAPIQKIPEDVLRQVNAEIVYFKSVDDIFDEFSGSRISVITPGKNNPSLLYSSGYFNELLSSQEFLPFISPSGAWAVCNNRFKILGKLSLSVYSLHKGTPAIKLTADRPIKTFQAEPLVISWAALRDVFYFSRADSIFRFDSQRREVFIAALADLHSFAVAPNEEKILACLDDAIGIYDLQTCQWESIHQIEKFLGTADYAGTKLCWAANSQSCCFSDRRRIYIHQQDAQQTLDFKSPKDIFCLAAINDREVVYVCGSYPPDGSQMRIVEEFAIMKLDIDSGLQTTLHSRYNHEPFSVRPELNGSTLLFSEKKLNGGYQVKLMTVDGRCMNTVCDGIYPSWKHSIEDR